MLAIPWWRRLAQAALALGCKGFSPTASSGWRVGWLRLIGPLLKGMEQALEQRRRSKR